jgi:tRNA threonylcarbamoyladenosine biosynthesis protein TsaB
MELSIDTASDRAGVALSQQGELIAELTWLSHANHSVELLPAIDQLLARAGAVRSDLSTVFVCRGPGSYGGLRAGLSTAMALAFALKLEILGLGRLEIDAFQHAVFPGPVCAVHRAGRGELAWASYAGAGGEWRELTPPRISWPEELLEGAPEGALFCGEIDAPLAEMLRERRGAATSIVTGNAAIRRPGALAELGWRRLATGERDSPLSVEPLYLREPQITLSRKNSG